MFILITQVEIFLGISRVCQTCSNVSISVDEAKEIAEKCISHYSDKYQIIAAVHEDTPHPHIHIGMNTTSYVDGSKYKGDKKDLYDFEKYVNEVLRSYGTHLKK